MQDRDPQEPAEELGGKAADLGNPSTPQSFLNLEAELPQFHQAFLCPRATDLAVSAPPDVNQWPLCPCPAAQILFLAWSLAHIPDHQLPGP